MQKHIFLTSLLVLATISSQILAFTIGSFNLHQYGGKKAANATLTSMVAELVNQFDLAIIQEVTDVTLTAPTVLHDALNKVSPSFYSMALSPRVGDSNTKEQFIFFNREKTTGVELIATSVYNDDAKDLFERAPYIGTFKVTKPGKSGVKFFTVMNVHLKPDHAYVETVRLRQVIEDFIQRNPQYFSETPTSHQEALDENVEDYKEAGPKSRLTTEHPILIIGDFNADCAYISLARQKLLRTIYFPDFHWVIENEAKTNTRQTCTYDRVFVNGQNFIDAIVPESNGTMRMDKYFGLNEQQTLLISDHMPIKFDVEL